MSRPLLGTPATPNDDDYEEVFLDGGKKSMRLDRSSKSKVCVLSARTLSIAWGNDSKYWRWVLHRDSRFEEVAELRSVCWLEITGKIDSKDLSPKTNYAAYFVFKTSDDSNGLDDPQEAILSIGRNVSKQTVCLKPPSTVRGYSNVRYPQMRMDGWTEMKIGEFYNDDGEDGEVVMKLLEITKLWWKSGLFVEGIEVRPEPTTLNHP